MRIGDLFTGKAERIASGGAGVLHVEGKAVFIDYAAPGDRIAGIITQDKGRWAKGKILEILDPSPHRREPRCPLFGACGGCSLQCLDYEAQLEEKARILRDAFSRIGALGKIPEIAIHPSQEYEYRNRLSLHSFRGALGFMRPGENSLIPIQDCPVMEGGIRRRLQEGSVKPRREGERFTCYGRGEIFLEEGIHQEGKIPFLHRELSMDPGVFFQGNALMAEALTLRLLELSQAADTRLPAADIYAGVGLFSAFLSDSFPEIDLIEENPRALDLARKNLPFKGRFFAQKDEDWVATRARPEAASFAAAYKKARGRKAPGAAKTGGSVSRYGLAVADPPREGLSPGMRAWLAEAGPPCLIYVSCDPSTMARDSGDLLRGGYVLESLDFFDFYPQTAHIEALGFLRKTI